MRSVAYDHEAAAQADTARALWKGGEKVIWLLEWALARDGDTAGLPLAGNTRMVHFPGAKSNGMPNVDCVFTVEAHRIVINDMDFYPA